MSAEATRGTGSSPDAAFKISPDGHPPFRSVTYAIAEHRVRVRVEEGFDIVVLSGGPGSGKTTLLTALSSDVQGVFLHRPPVDFPDLVRQCWTPIGDGAARDGKRLILLIDDADRMPIDILIAAQEAGPERQGLRFQFVLACLPTAAERFNRAAMDLDAALTSCHLAVLEDSEIAPFVAHRLTLAGEDPNLFTRGALLRTAEYARGTPRLVNLLCANARLVAGAGRATRISAEDIDEAATLLGLEASPDAVESAPAFDRLETVPPEDQAAIVSTVSSPTLSLQRLARLRLDAVLQRMRHGRMAARVTLVGALIAVVATAIVVGRMDRSAAPTVAGSAVLPTALAPVAIAAPRADANRPAAAPAVPARYVGDLLARGRSLWTAGEFRAARMFLGLAAADGDPVAARELAETYDPYYAKAGGRDADPDMALRWYRAAAAGGDREAEGRLFALTHDMGREASAR